MTKQYFKNQELPKIKVFLAREKRKIETIKIYKALEQVTFALNCIRIVEDLQNRAYKN